jgi:hypothetical protein
MSVVFDVLDPKGRRVICSDECWTFHILDHHPEIENYLDEIQKAIQAPDLPIATDRDRVDRNVYYGRLQGNPRYIKVVVDFKEKLGEVIQRF